VNEAVATYADVVRYRELFANLFRRDFQAKYRGSALGIGWTLVNPVLLMGIYLLVFSTVWRAPFANGGHYPLFLLVGLATWIFFSTSIQFAAQSMLDNAGLIRKTRFPRQLVPLSVVAAHLVSYAVMLAILLVLNFALLPRVRGTEWLAIPLAAVFVALVSGLALAVASLNAVFRDVQHLVGALLLPLFFLTPIIYPLSGLPESVLHHHTAVQLLRYGNPLSPAVEAIRAPLFYGKLPSWIDVVYLCAAAAVALAIGAVTFRRVDDQIAVEV
jgi:ABC-type polysaccharide/polyol phosphate export permease